METVNDLFGSTRNIVRERYALLTPSGFVHGYLPGWEKTVCNVMISPRMGAEFSQIHFTVEKHGGYNGTTGSNEHFFFVMGGAASFSFEGKNHQLPEGGYAYIPGGLKLEINASSGHAYILCFQKPYQPVEGQKQPQALIGHESRITADPFLGNEDARLQVLLPDMPAFDMAVNIFTYRPGATLPFVETHIMEHGLVMLKGQGIYRLDSDWHPVKAGDVIWMAPYCPQWFVAMGNTPASYIYYKDVNRDPL
jgi:(S)-ureidoglycine aminohydrolase